MAQHHKLATATTPADLFAFGLWSRIDHVGHTSSRSHAARVARFSDPIKGIKDFIDSQGTPDYIKVIKFSSSRVDFVAFAGGSAR
jgi:hypothetical protein